MQRDADVVFLQAVVRLGESSLILTVGLTRDLCAMNVR